MDQIRQNAVKEMIASVGEEKWNKNMEFLQVLISSVKDHKINQHPIVSTMSSCEYSLQEMQTIHMEYRAIVTREQY